MIARKKKPKPGINKNRVTLGIQNTIVFCGFDFDVGIVDVQLSAKRHDWTSVSYDPPTATTLTVYGTPSHKRGPTRDSDDDLTLTMTVDDGSGTPATDTEVTYEEITYEGRRRRAKSAKKKVAKKKKQVSFA